MAMDRPEWWLWAKTGAGQSWHPLAAHLVDTTLVARKLWSDWLAPATRHWLAKPFDGDETLAASLFALLAGCHDLGKASPAFQVQADWLVGQLKNVGFPLEQRLPQRSKAPHALVSAATIGPLLKAYGWEKDSIEGVAAVLGGHHGWFPSLGYESEPVKRPKLYGYSTSYDDPWSKARERLFALVIEFSGAAAMLPAAGNVRLGSARELTLAGFVIVADWIASNESLFPYLSNPYDETYCERAQVQAEGVLPAIGWHPARFVASPGPEWFCARFGFPPNELQRHAVAVSCDPELGLLVIETPMGSGKTEAALAAAELSIARRGYGGVFFGLPTQATSNQMFHRCRRWLEQVGSGTFHLELAHGRAHQVPEYRELAQQGGPSALDLDGDADSGARVTAEAWFAGPKRRLLAPFVVGTIDQALMTVAKVRHVALRHAGLAGKVVIFDEVHAYDAYVSVFLRRVLRWLGQEGIPVVLLSATLPPEARSRLVEAYVGGPVELRALAYPSVTAVSSSGKAVTRPVATNGRSVTVCLEQCGEDPDDGTHKLVAERVAQMALQGANVLVVRNTVRRAQATYRTLAAMLPERSVHLLHARFRLADRLEREAWLAERFGPGANRPTGQVVVGTQVLEQSLDVDFDVLVTDLAPIDLVLQRLGRVHRHSNVDRPDGFTQPLAVLAGFSHGPGAAPRFPPGSVQVYGEHLLLRSAAVLLDRESLDLPDDVASLVAAVYGHDELVPGTWSERAANAAAEWRAAELQREAHAEQYAIAPPEEAAHLLELCRIGLGDPDDDDPAVQAAVRDAAPTVAIVIGAPGTAPGTVRCGSVELSIERAPSPDEVDAILGSVLSLPPFLTVAALRLEAPAAWRAHPWLRSQRLLLLDADGEGMIGQRRLRYSETLGLEVSSRGE